MLPIQAVFVARATASPLTDIRTVARVYSLTPAEARLVQQLIAGASLTEAATALGIGVSRRTDLLALITRLIPPVRPSASASTQAPPIYFSSTRVISISRSLI